MIARKIGPVLAVGCTAVIKVPAETPYTNLAIMEVCRCRPSSFKFPDFAVGETGRHSRRRLERSYVR